MNLEQLRQAYAAEHVDEADFNEASFSLVAKWAVKFAEDEAGKAPEKLKAFQVAADEVLKMQHVTITELFGQVLYPDAGAASRWQYSAIGGLYSAKVTGKDNYHYLLVAFSEPKSVR